MPLPETYSKVQYPSLIVASTCSYDFGTISSLASRSTLVSSQAKHAQMRISTALIRRQLPAEKPVAGKRLSSFSFASVFQMLLAACHLSLVV